MYWLGPVDNNAGKAGKNENTNSVPTHQTNAQTAMIRRLEPYLTFFKTLITGYCFQCKIISVQCDQKLY